LSSKQKILIIGSGDLAFQINHYLKEDLQTQIVGFVDDFMPVGKQKFNKKCLGNLSDLEQLYSKKIYDKLVCAIGYKHLKFRQELFRKLKKIPFYTFIHKSAIIESSVHLGQDVFICPGVFLGPNVSVHDHVFIYNSVSISHDSIIGSNTFISPNVCVAGFTKIGSSCKLGINTTIIDNINIADNVKTGGGTVVINNLNQSGLYVGNPARFLKDDSL